MILVVVIVVLSRVNRLLIQLHHSLIVNPSPKSVKKNELLTTVLQSPIIRNHLDYEGCYRLPPYSSLLHHHPINLLNPLLNPTFNTLNQLQSPKNHTLTSLSTTLTRRSASLTFPSPPVILLPRDKYPCQSSSISASISFSNLSTQERNSELKSSRVRNWEWDRRNCSVLNVGVEKERRVRGVGKGRVEMSSESESVSWDGREFVRRSANIEDMTRQTVVMVITNFNFEDQQKESHRRKYHNVYE